MSESSDRPSPEVPILSAGRVAAEAKVLSDPVRLKLIVLVAESKGYLSVAHLAQILSISPALASYHLRIAKKAGILRSPTRGSYELGVAGEWWLAVLKAREKEHREFRDRYGLSLRLVRQFMGSSV